MAERIVTYKLKVIEESGNKGRLQAFGNSLVAAEKEFAKQRALAHKEGLSRMADAERRFGTEVNRMYTRYAKDSQTLASKSAKAAADAASVSMRRVAESQASAMNRITSASSKAIALTSAAEKESGKATEETTKRQTVSLTELQAKADELKDRYQTASRAVQGSFEETTSAVLQFGRGIASLGLLSAKNTEQIVKGLLVVQGTFDIVNGSVKTILKAGQFFTDLKASQEALSRATVAAAQANAAAIAQETAATRALAVARTQANAAAGVGVRTGAVSAGASVAGSAAGSRVGGILGGAATGAAGGAVVKGGVSSAVAGSASVVASSFAALAGAAFAVTSAFLSVREAAKNGFQQGAAPGTFVDSVAGSKWNFFAENRMIAGLERSRVRSQEASNQRRAGDLAFSRLGRERTATFAGIRTDEALNNLSIGITARQATPESDVGAQLEAVKSQLEFLRGETAGVMAEAANAFPIDQAKTALSISQQETGLLQEQLRLQVQAKDERLSSAREALQLAREELKVAQQNLAAEEERLISAKERFGQMSAADQQRVIAIKQRADAGQELTKEERSLLRGVGTDDAVAEARKRDLADAEQAGFDQIFGREQQKAINEQRQTIQQKLQVEVEQLQQVEINVQQNADAVIQALREEIQRSNTQLIERMREVAREEFTQRGNQTRDQFEQRQQGLNAALGGGR